jgi:tRNA splicing ligase
MKVLLRVYEYKETLEQEFSSIEEAQDILNLISKNYPELRLESYIEVEEGSVCAS